MGWGENHPSPHRRFILFKLVPTTMSSQLQIISQLRKAFGVFKVSKAPNYLIQLSNIISIMKACSSGPKSLTK